MAPPKVMGVFVVGVLGVVYEDVGALRQRDELVPRQQLFVRSQLAWVNDLNSIPKFDGMPPQ